MKNSDKKEGKNNPATIQTANVDVINEDAHVYEISKIYGDEWSLLDSRTGFGHYLGYEENIYIQIGNLLIPANDKEIKIILQ